MFRTVGQKFGGIVFLLVVIFCVAYAQVAIFLHKQSETARLSRHIVSIDRSIRDLSSLFHELRYWEQAVFSPDFSDAEKRFGALLAKFKAKVAALDGQPFDSWMDGRLARISEVLAAYEQDFNRLLQINTEQRLKMTRFDSGFQSLASSILRIRQPQFLKPLFFLSQFQAAYVENHRGSEHKALLLVVDSLQSKLAAAGVLDQRLAGYFESYRMLLSQDMALAQQFHAVSQQFNQRSDHLTELLAATAVEAESKLLQESKRADVMASRLNRWFLMSMAASFVAILLVSAIVARTIVRPVRSVAQVMHAIQSGNLDARFAPSGRRSDEITQLGLTFNETLNALAEKGKQLVRSQVDLESKVGELAARETEREALIAELEAKNTELERFTYTVSHDLKSPLITIQGFLGFMQHDADAGNWGRMQSDFSRIQKAAQKMQQLLDELLELSRIGRLLNPPEEFRFGDVVTEALDMVEGRLKKHGIEVVVHAGLPTLVGDRQRIREVLENLLDNASKSMGLQPKPRIEVGCRPKESENVLFVRDNGIGIDPSYHERVFGLFEKLDSKADGTGVGLAIAKRIVEVHGGRIWVESEGSGRGSTFCFTVPSPERVKNKDLLQNAQPFAVSRVG